MTVWLEFRAELLYLAFVKKVLIENELNERDSMVVHSNCAAVIILCAAAIEAWINHVYITTKLFTAYDELRITSKISLLAELTGNQLHKGKRPWQDVFELIDLRNFLLHRKTTNMGLYGTTDEDGLLVPADKETYKRINLDRVLSFKKLNLYYKSTKNAMIEMAKWANIDSEDLEKETYDNYWITG